MARIKRTSDATAIRRGIEYARREIVAMNVSDVAYLDAMTRTDIYRGYLNNRARRLFEQAWFYTFVNKLWKEVDTAVAID